MKVTRSTTVEQAPSRQSWCVCCAATRTGSGPHGAYMPIRAIARVRPSDLALDGSGTGSPYCAPAAGIGDGVTERAISSGGADRGGDTPAPRPGRALGPDADGHLVLDDHRRGAGGVGQVLAHPGAGDARGLPGPRLIARTVTLTPPFASASGSSAAPWRLRY